jgi:hypothetical protein
LTIGSPPWSSLSTEGKLYLVTNGEEETVQEVVEALGLVGEVSEDVVVGDG